MDKLDNSKKTVYVAMSGGVDSSVAAALLKRQHFNVVGVYFKPWSPDKNVAYCDWREERQAAMRAAAMIGISFKTWDFSRQYGQKVARYMIGGYRCGLTPNPDVRCNKEIKFGLFLKKALAEGANYIATGHYVRLCETKDQKLKVKITNQNSKVWKLLKAKDLNKDQTYFLWTLTQQQLQHCLFPIGDYTKPQVRQLAKCFGLPNWDKPDSQGVCFIGRLDIKDFLQTHIKPRAGQIVLADSGAVLGRHDGVYYYTVGQRHGLNIQCGDGPYFVCSKDVKKNIVYVTKQPSVLDGRQAVVKDLNWLTNRRLPLDAGVKIRYRTKVVPARVVRNGSLKTALIKFRQPARAIAPGQSAVFYRGQQVLGGGVVQ